MKAYTISTVAFIMSYFIKPRVRSLYYQYSNDPSIRDAFDKSHFQYISNTLHIIRSVFKPQFMHFTKYAKCLFLLLFSIHLDILRLKYDLNMTFRNKPESEFVWPSGQRNPNHNDV